MTDQYLKVVDAPGLYRDPVSKAIIACDESAKEAHIKKKQAMMGLISKNRELKTEVDMLKEQMSKLEKLVTDLVSKSVEK